MPTFQVHRKKACVDGAHLRLSSNMVALRCSINVCAENRSQGTSAQRAKAWESWWSEQRPSHFNAMLAKDRRKAAQAQREEDQRESDVQRTNQVASDAQRTDRAARDAATTPAAAVRHVQSWVLIRGRFCG